MRIAIFGGSFNPVHSEHINIVKAAKSRLGLDRVIIVPSNITPNKYGKMTVSAEHRVNLLKLAFNGIDGVEVSDCELKRGGVSYSYVTCREFREKYPDDELYFIVGADMLENFSTWRYPEEILKCVTLAVCARENTESLTAAESRFVSLFGTRTVNINYVGARVSSTRVRVLAALGESIADYVTEAEEEYIVKNAIYALPQLIRVKEYLKPERWRHTVRVAIMAAENCSRFSVPELTAVTAAALHDCAKYVKQDDPLLDGFTLPENVPEPVIHQFTGAYLAEHLFGIKDAEILNAIRYHTTGRANMTPLEKLIFMADMLEEGRSYDGIEKLREEFSRSIDGGLCAALERSIAFVREKGAPVCPLTQAALDYLKG